MRILEQLVNLERKRTAKPSIIKRISIWIQYRILLMYGIEKIINQKEYPELITLLRDFTTVVNMCKVGVHKDTSKIATYLPVLRYDLIERHASEDHLFLNHQIHYYNLVLTHPILHNIYMLSFNSDEDMIDTTEYYFDSLKDKNTYLNSRYISTFTNYKVTRYDLDGKKYNAMFTAMITTIIEELVKLIEKEGINP